MNIWKLGCNWGSGAKNFYDYIKEKSIVLCASHEMELGDFVAICKGFEVCAIAKVTSPRFCCIDFSELEKEFSNYQIDYEDWNFFAKALFYELPKNKRFKYQLQQGICKIQHADIQNQIKAFIPILNQQEEKEKQMENIYKSIDLLTLKKNIILQGAPGTGKTYNCITTAVGIIKGKKFIKGKKHDEIMREYEKLCKSGNIFFCTFHQSMDYEDFVEGLKPQIIESDDGNSVIYDIEDGIFKHICNNAQSNDNFAEVYEKFITEIAENYDEENILKLKTPRGKEFGVFVNSKDNLVLCTGTQFKKQGVLTKENIHKQLLRQKIYRGWEGYFNAVIECIKSKYKLSFVQNINNNYVLIIDEINRGNVSKIFGELITLLEFDKRFDITGKHQQEFQTITVKLPYSKKDFSVPSNLYILGTMNTTDRSTGTLDYAVRRRFAFVTLTANISLVDKKACDTFNNIQEFIRYYQADKDISLEDLYPGHSYFMAGNAENNLKIKIEYEVIPLIQEYIKVGLLKNIPDEQNLFFKTWKLLGTRKIKMQTLELQDTNSSDLNEETTEDD